MIHLGEPSGEIYSPYLSMLREKSHCLRITFPDPSSNVTSGLVGGVEKSTAGRLDRTIVLPKRTCCFHRFFDVVCRVLGVWGSSLDHSKYSLVQMPHLSQVVQIMSGKTHPREAESRRQSF